MPLIQYRLRKEVLAWRTLGEESMIVDPRGRRMHYCNQAATSLVSALGGRATEEDLVAVLCDVYEVDAERARADIRGLLPRLLAEGLLEERVQERPPTEEECSGRACSRAMTGDPARSDDRAFDARAESRVPLPAKRPYAPPVVESSELFYAAAGCGKSAPSVSQCFALPKHS
jgi:hypothetical protein